MVNSILKILMTLKYCDEMQPGYNGCILLCIYTKKLPRGARVSSAVSRQPLHLGEISLVK